MANNSKIMVSTSLKFPTFTSKRPIVAKSKSNEIQCQPHLPPAVFFSAVQHSAPHFSFRCLELCNGCGSVTSFIPEQRYVLWWLAFQRCFGLSPSFRDALSFRDVSLSLLSRPRSRRLPAFSNLFLNSF